jgi:hypothetical protein
MSASVSGSSPVSGVNEHLEADTRIRFLKDDRFGATSFVVFGDDQIGRAGEREVEGAFVSSRPWFIGLRLAPMGRRTASRRPFLRSEQRAAANARRGQAVRAIGRLSGAKD